MSALSDAVTGEAITLARCWRIERRDGTVLGFTDHDEPIAFEGTTFQASTGIDGAVADASLGLNVDEAEIAGALSSDSLSENDLAAGLYDDAEVRLYVVDWTDPSLHKRMATYTVGGVVRIDGAFRIELRGLVQKLERVTARRFRRLCDAVLGDERCGVPLDNAASRLEAVIVGVDGDAFSVEDLDGIDRSFDNGTVRWLDGANEGRTARIVSASVDGGTRTVRTWQPSARPIAVGDRVVLTIGCDKSFVTCRDRFGNGENFRGFPYLPGNDFAFSYASEEGEHDGLALMR